jgi:hypothetical protein
MSRQRWARTIAFTSVLSIRGGVGIQDVAPVGVTTYLRPPHKSLSSIAREITGTKWNGLVFFGLKRHPVRS